MTTRQYRFLADENRKGFYVYSIKLGKLIGHMTRGSSECLNVAQKKNWKACFELDMFFEELTAEETEEIFKGYFFEDITIEFDAYMKKHMNPRKRRHTSNIRTLRITRYW